MGIAFALFILVVLGIGIFNRRRQNRTWVREERYDESGAWVDKRAGERGLFGSLDEERETERRLLARQGQGGELARRVREYCFEHYPDFHALSDAQIRVFLDFLKGKAGEYVVLLGDFAAGRIPAEPASQAAKNEHLPALKSKLLDFAYERYPALLDLDIDVLKLLDRHTEVLAAELIARIEALKTGG